MNMKNTHAHFQKLDRLLLDRVIISYFSLFKKIFKKEIYEYSVGKHFHNFILKYVKKVDMKIIKKINSDILVKFSGLNFIIRDHRIYYDLLRLGIYESMSSYIIKNFLKKGMNILDIGGNIGYFTLFFSKMVGDLGKVYVFEPDPTSYKYLRKNLQINNIKNVETINYCVSNEEGTLFLYHHPEFHSCHSLFKSSAKRAKKSVEVKVITLNDMFKNNDLKFQFIKMDIEGSELNALKGMDIFLKKNRVSAILTECNLRILKNLGKGAKDLVNELKKYFNKFYVILDEKSLNLELFLDAESLIKYLESLNQNNLNLFCIK